MTISAGTSLNRIRSSLVPFREILACFIGFGVALSTGYANVRTSQHSVDGGALLVEIDGAVPEGYRPSWDFVVRAQELPLTLEGSDRLFRGQLQMGNAGGRSTVLFRVNGVGELCQAFLTPDSRPVLLGTKPTTLRLTEFRSQDGTGPCQENARRARDWSGQLTLTATPSGDISLDVALVTEDRKGKPLRFLANSIPMKNRVPVGGASNASASLAPPGRAPSAVSVPAATPGEPGQYSLDGGSLFVVVEGTYPQGYAPRWDYIGRAKEVPLQLDGSERLVRAMLVFWGAEGRSTVAFRIPGFGEACVADLQPTPNKVVLGTAPSRFTLSNFRKEKVGGPCTEPGGRRTREWAATISMTAAPNGSVTMDLEFVTEADRKGRQSLLFARAVPISNRMTPEAAVADIAQKAEAAKRAEEARRAAIAAMQLPEPDLAAMESSPRPSKSLVLEIAQADDFAFAIVVTPDGKWTGVAEAEWNGGNPGQARQELSSHFKTGDNLLILGLHNKRFAFGPGRWSVAAQVSDDKGPVWTKSTGAAGGSVGIRYWKPFAVAKARNGQLTLRAASPDQTSPAIERMKAFNNWLIREMGSERSMMAAVAGAVTQSLTSSMGSSGRPLNEDEYEIERTQQGGSSTSPSAPMTPIGGSGGLYGCASPPCW